MGRGKRTKFMPARLAEKLVTIRLALGIPQAALVEKLGDFPNIDQSIISAYERGKREPPALVLLGYARVANIYVDVLIDDDLDLPGDIPAVQKHAGVPAANAN